MKRVSPTLCLFFLQKNPCSFAKILMNLDRNVARLLRALDENGALQDTLIAFASDNGACPQFGGFQKKLETSALTIFEV